MAKKIAILGLGNMGGAIAKGLRCASDVELYGFDVDEAKVRAEGVAFVKPENWFDPAKPEFAFDAVVIAVKPQYLEECLRVFRHTGRKNNALWMSVVAGVQIGKLKSLLSLDSKICRVMPNTPALIGQGASAFSLSESCNESDSHLSRQILDSLGPTTINVPEKQLDAVTGLSGSGPAYVYLFIEALIEAGVTAGLPYDTARELAVQTVIGSAALVKESGEAPAVLKSRVTSPGGTTARGLLELERGAFKATVINAVEAAFKRSVELGS